MYKNLTLLFIFALIYSCAEPVEEIESDSFLNIAGARVGLASQQPIDCLLYTSPSPRDRTRSRMPSSA